jgi:uncharacterized phage protein (TIGR01671 family)
MAMSVRKIEFRAWDKREKRMGEVTEIRFSKSQYPCVNVRFKQNGKIIDERYCFGQKDGCDNVILMRYIGRKDINGKDICEGDVVSFDDSTSTESGYWERGCIGVVEWCNETVSFEVSNRLSAESYEVLDECVVIGNIYDNPELLQEG